MANTGNLNHMKEKKQDNSQKIPQRDKLKGTLNIRELNWTDKQKQFFDIAFNKDTKIIFVNGPAGVSKTLVAVYICLHLINQKKISDILFIRSAVESADAKLGYLPGTVEEKLMYYGLPFMDKLEELLDKASIDLLKKENRFEITPVNYARGRSWNAKGIIIDEAQNLTHKELMTLLTRLGKYNKCFVLGDPMQSDLYGNKSNAFSDVTEAFRETGKEHGVEHFTFTKDDILRDELVKYIVEVFENLLKQPLHSK